MTELEILLNNAKKINVGFLLKQLFLDVKFKEFVLDLNRYNQLYDEGIDSKGKRLKSAFAREGQYYAANTILGTPLYEGKLDKAQPYDRVTLSDTGKFYDSFKLYLKSQNFYIMANTIKFDTDLQEVWGNDILGLTDESLKKVVDLSIEIIIPIVLSAMFK